VRHRDPAADAGGKDGLTFHEALDDTVGGVGELGLGEHATETAKQGFAVLHVGRDQDILGSEVLGQTHKHLISFFVDAAYLLGPAPSPALVNRAAIPGLRIGRRSR
jgi:hypothetical protein